MTLDIPDEAPISRSPATEHLANIEPLGEHRPEWLGVDCPSCDGSIPCNHSDVLACRECCDDWPCAYAKATAVELDRLADQIEREAHTPDVMAAQSPAMAALDGAVRQGALAMAKLLRARARELRGGTHD